MERKEDTANVLIADSDPKLARFVLEILARKGIRGHLVGSRKGALDFINKGTCDFLLAGETIDPGPEGSSKPQDGFELLAEVRAIRPELPVVMVADAQNNGSQNNEGTIETAIKAIRQGCRDFLTRPPQRQKMEVLLDSFLPNHGVCTVAAAQEDIHCLYRIVGRTPSLVQTVNLAKRIAPTSAPVLISGESGTGKELIAYLVHQKSRRAQGPYTRINCAALSESLLESELFGHEKGAFTGAYTQRKGRFEMAHGGTLLLDEITETPVRFQAKLLRVLEQQDFERVGGNESVRVDVRIISTTNKDLLQEVRQDRFRADLYYRLSGTRLVLSPLRERKDDLSDLVWYFVNLYAREVQRHITKLDETMMDIFAKYHWPGNVRQLRNVVRTSLILGVGPVLSLADVSWLFDELQPLEQPECRAGGTPFEGMPLEQIERQVILDTLRQTGGNRTKAAKVLGISDRTLRDKMHRYQREGCLQSA
jgi:DNA-binding NtrC family response regulator